MVDILTRLGKGLPLTNLEMDTNLTNIKTAIEAFGVSGGGGNTSVTFDSYSLVQGDLVVTKTTPLITSQAIVNGELIVEVR